MATAIKPKRSTVTGNVPTTANIVQYEIAINTADKKIFTRDGADAIVQLASGSLAGLSDVAVSSPTNGQTLTYNSTTGKWQNSAASGTEVDTLATVTGRGATTATALSITNATASTTKTSGALTLTGGLGVGDSVYVGNRFGFVNGSNVSVVYQVYNAAANSLDTVFA